MNCSRRRKRDKVLNLCLDFAPKFPNLNLKLKNEVAKILYIIMKKSSIRKHDETGTEISRSVQNTNINKILIQRVELHQGMKTASIFCFQNL